MRNKILIRKIQLGKATPGEYREYARRVAERKQPDDCEHGHFDCALVFKGPCTNECLSNAEEAKSPEPVKKFKLQERANPKRRCTADIDDRSSCCEACLTYFERDYDNKKLGGYEGCEECGAALPKPKRRKRQAPFVMYD